MDEDYDIYGGAPWSAYHDDIDPWEAEYERRAEQAAEAEYISAENEAYEAELEAEYRAEEQAHREAEAEQYEART